MGQPPATPAPSPFEGIHAPGAMVAGRYRIIALVGEGGMGEVYLADDLTLGQEVALKFLSERIERREGGLERFFAEVRAARRVTHPNVARVHDVGEADGRRFLSMEFVDGEDLSRLLRRIGRLPAEKAADIAQQLCAGLCAIHSAGILHRDLKPANVMLDGDGNVRITDFGLAVAEGEADARSVAGTPEYMAPEQLEGAPASERSEVFSLGLVLHEIFTGRTVDHEHKGRTPSSPSRLVPNLDPAVEQTIQRCLAPDPAARPPSVRAVARSLPGGDPLAAAIAAGETPAPEVVADAPDDDVMSPRVAVLCLGAFAASVLTCVALKGRQQDALPPLPPETLVQDARDFLEEIGHDVPRSDSTYSFVCEETEVDRVQDESDPPGGRDRVVDHDASPLAFWYRESPTNLFASIQFLLQPRWDDPPLVTPGMVRMWMSTRGELRSFSRVPPAYVANDTKASPDWRPFFAAAGLADRPREPVEPKWSLDVPSDARYAWEVPAEGDRPALRVEAGSAGGEACAFRVQRSDRAPVLGSTHRVSRSRDQIPTIAGARWVLPALGTILLVLGAWLAARNLRQGRGDRRGTMRLALACFASLLFAWACIANHATDPVLETGALWQRLSTALFFSVLLAVLYLATEPYYRKLWPRLLVSWVRVLDGRFGDRLVGRDLLLGALCGSAIGLIGAFLPWIADRLGGPPVVPASSLEQDRLLLSFNGVPSFVGALPTIAREAVVGTLFLVTLFVALRLFLRNQLAVVVALFALYLAMYTPKGGPEWLVLLLSSVGVALSLACFLKLGILAAVAATFVYSALGSLPLTLDMNAWFAGRSVVALLLILSIGVWGLRATVAGRPVFRDVLGEG